MKHYQIIIDRDEALRYLGYHGESPDEQIKSQIEQAVSVLNEISVPAFTYKICALLREEVKTGILHQPHLSEGTEPESMICLKGTSLTLRDRSSASFLEGCHSCIMMAVTIGRQVDAEIRRFQVTDMAQAVILDSCASTAVESICQQLETDLETEYESRGLYLTDRFSPGYGDLPLTLQTDICRALSTEKTIGLSLTNGMLMMPSKSVTAFIGIADHPVPKKISGCSRCHMSSSCNYRKAGATCAE